jgi:hypothetical protein
VLAEKTFIGQRLDLEHYKNVSIVNHEMTFVDVDEEPYPLSAFSVIRFDLFAKPHGKLIQSAEQDIPGDNVLVLNVPGEVFNIRPTLYYYEIWGSDNNSPTEDILLTYGILELI